MARKLIIIAEAGIDTAVALTTALLDPRLEVLAVAGVAGIEPADATNGLLHALLQHIDPKRLPRFGAALPGSAANEACTQQKLGLSKTPLKPSALHHPHPADKVISEIARQYAGEISVLTLGPLTALALALERDRDLPRFVKSFIIVGGLSQGPGNAGPMSEYHFACDPVAARLVINTSLPKTVIPLEVSQAILFAPAELDQLTQGGGPACRLLQTLCPLGIHDLAQEQAIEGMYLPDVLGVAFAAESAGFKSRPTTVDIETRGELSRGLCVIDHRRNRKAPNVDWVFETNTDAVRTYLFQTLREA